MNEHDVDDRKYDLTALSEDRTQKDLSLFFYFLFLGLFLIATFATRSSAMSRGNLLFEGYQIPKSALAGVFSSIANICLIFLVVYFKRLGFFTTMAILAYQFPTIIINIIRSHNPASLPGLFTNVFTLFAIILIYQRNRKIENYQKKEITRLIEQQNLSQRLFEQTATALVNAIDAKDTYSHGHSMRVAEYSEKIAREMGKSEEDCKKIYYAGLLHDVGKIGIRIDILNKNGKLTDEEYENIKLHPVLGNQILSSISEYPYLSIGAHHHHERYDGRGYPDKLKGDDIPEIARIISVADAYDAMTSKRSYRDAIPQQLVREEIVKNSGTQFDPEVAKVMLHLIDQDIEYEMKERTTAPELAGRNELHCNEYREEISDGILIRRTLTRMKFRCISESDPVTQIPTLIVFDSLDGRVHKDEKTIKDLNFYEYAEIRFDGQTTCHGARKSKTETKKLGDHEADDMSSHHRNEKIYSIEAARVTDHMLITINDGSSIVTVTLALPDSSRYSYVAITGEHCALSDLYVEKSEQRLSEDYIPRIAEKVSYIDGPEGDIPNIQIDGHRSASTAGVPITDGLKIKFHTKSLPTARLIWHCPFIDIYHSADGKVKGEDYRDYALIRLDGENWKGKGDANNHLTVNKTEQFQNWDEWKRLNKAGFDCEVRFTRDGNEITVSTLNHGVDVYNVTTIRDGMEDVYVALSGDQCVLSNIRVIRK